MDALYFQAKIYLYHLYATSHLDLKDHNIFWSETELGQNWISRTESESFINLLHLKLALSFVQEICPNK